MKALINETQRVNDEDITLTVTIGINRKEYTKWIKYMDEVGVVELALVNKKDKE